MGTNVVSPIGYYVHHHGTGHLRRALAIIEHISQPVVIFCSLDKPDDLPKNAMYVRLPLDVVPNYQQPAGNIFLYSPYDSKIFDRNQVMIDTWKSLNIRHMYVDVSIEVVVLAKLYGLSVGHAIMHGHRADQAHSYGYDACDYLLAHMSPYFDEPSYRKTQTPVFYSGGISRFKKKLPVPFQKCQSVAVMVSPKAERSLEPYVIELAEGFPEIDWHCVGFSLNTRHANIYSHGIVNEPLALLSRADVVISSAGNNSIMEIASLAKPFICIPEARPFDEQVVAAEALQRLNAAVYLPDVPVVKDWPLVVAKLRSINLQVFSELASNDAAQVAAHIIESAGRN